MRIIAGSARGNKLFSPDGVNARPTSDRVRESVFNILGDVNGVRFLDLFGGSGAVGIEALSRGAAMAVFVEISAKCSDTIKKNIRKTKFLENSKVLTMDAFKALDFLKSENYTFDIIFLDPPYSKGQAQKAFQQIEEKGLLEYGGVVVAELSSTEKWPDAGKEHFRLDNKEYRIKKYGDTKIAFISDVIL